MMMKQKLPIDIEIRLRCMEMAVAMEPPAMLAAPNPYNKRPDQSTVNVIERAKDLYMGLGGIGPFPAYGPGPVQTSEPIVMPKITAKRAKRKPNRAKRKPARRRGRR